MKLMLQDQNTSRQGQYYHPSVYAFKHKHKNRNRCKVRLCFRCICRGCKYD